MCLTIGISILHVGDVWSGCIIHSFRTVASVSYDDLLQARDYIRKHTSIRPEIGVICGSGLGGLADRMDVEPPALVISYENIPHFPSVSGRGPAWCVWACLVNACSSSIVAGHAGNLVFGYFSGKPAVCMQGRFHCYEGHPVHTVSLELASQARGDIMCGVQVTLPVRVMHLLGVKTLVVTNASGGLNRSFNIGDIMIMKDHINLPGMAGCNPLIGPNDTRLGLEFSCM